MNRPPRQPRHFHLLWDDDLDELREVLKAIRDRRQEVVSHWYELYVLHFGDQRSLSESEFRQIFEPALLRNQDALLSKDMDGYAASVLQAGRQLAEHHVPLDELIAATQLFEEAAQAVFPHDPPPAAAVFVKFDKLSHIRIILLVGAYSALQSAAASVRIHALELNARSLPAHERTRFHGLVGPQPGDAGTVSAGARDRTRGWSGVDRWGTWQRAGIARTGYPRMRRAARQVLRRATLRGIAQLPD
jgi:hypothetical protein